MRSFVTAGLPAGLNAPGHTHYNEVTGFAPNQWIVQVGGVWQYTWVGGTANANVRDVAGIPGQNSPNPASIFGNHEVVAIGNTIYDPSYGVTYVVGPANTPLVNFEPAAVAGYYSFVQTTINGVTHYYVLFKTPGAGLTSQRLVMG